MKNKDIIENKEIMEIKDIIKKKKMDIPKYVLDGNQNIPEGIKIIRDYFNDCSNQKYELCLVGDKETLAEDLQKDNLKVKEFISTSKITKENLRKYFFWLPLNVIKSFLEINKMISNPDNEFNKTELGIHTLALVPKTEIKELKKLGYGLTSWNSLEVYANTVGFSR